MLASFLENCKIFREGDTGFVFTVNDSFTEGRINASREKIARNLSPLIGKAVSADDVKVAVGSTADGDDPFEEI